MLIAQKGNKQLKIQDLAKDSYVANGWDIMDEKGKILVSATSKDVKMNDAQKKLIGALATLNVADDLTVGAAKAMSEVLGVEFESKEKSSEALQSAYDSVMKSIKF